MATNDANSYTLDISGTSILCIATPLILSPISTFSYNCYTL